MRTGEEKMKIRNGFVSNSSSSSFCLYGACLDKGEMLEIKFKDTKNKEDYDEYDDDEEFGDNWERLEKALHEFNLSGEGDYDWTDMYIGRSWTKIKDEETARQFKDNIEKDIKAFFHTYLPNSEQIIEYGTYEEAWYPS